jgi:hypothetical protein
MINVIRAIRMPPPIWFVSQRTRQSLNPTPRRIIGTILFLFQFRIQILTQCTSQNFMLHGSQTGSTPKMSGGGSSVAG